MNQSKFQMFCKNTSRKIFQTSIHIKLYISTFQFWPCQAELILENHAFKKDKLSDICLICKKVWSQMISLEKCSSTSYASIEKFFPSSKQLEIIFHQLSAGSLLSWHPHLIHLLSSPHQGEQYSYGISFVTPCLKLYLFLMVHIIISYNERYEGFRYYLCESCERCERDENKLLE